jgi:hypothetical protein
MKAENTSETMETLLISTRYKKPTEDSTSTVNQRQNLVGLAVFLKHLANVNHKMGGRRTRGALICLNIPFGSKGLATALSSSSRRNIIR